MTTMPIGVPVDHTNGTGVFPVGGVITLPANVLRRYLYIQNQDVGDIKIEFAGVKSSDGTDTTVSVYLAGGGSSPSQGGAEELTSQSLLITGQITVTGTAGQHVCVFEAY